MTIRTTIAAALAAATLATPTYAEDICPLIGKLAQTIMTNRQSGVVMSDQMAVLPQIDDNLKGLYRNLVMDAWRQPQWAYGDMQQRAITGFRNDVEAICYEAQE